MSVGIIGGMNRLQRHYLREARNYGIQLSIFNKMGAGMADRLRHMDAVVIFTGKVSHSARNKAMDVARSNDIPVYMFHSCGVCTVRKCFHCLVAAPALPDGPDPARGA